MEGAAGGPSNSGAAANKLHGQVPLPRSQILFPLPSADPNGAALQRTWSWEAVATPPVLAAARGTKPTGWLQKTLGTARENMMGNGEGSPCVCPRGRRPLAQRPQDEAAWWHCMAGLQAGMSSELFPTISAKDVALVASNLNVIRSLRGNKIETEKVIGQSAAMKPVGQKYPTGQPWR